MMSTDKFYLGRNYDPAKGKPSTEPLLYDPDDLTTHAVVVGMTGSGKTGLCIALLEEAALQGLPAIMVDPKGDMTNTLLHFPDLLPADFQPWVNPDAARREGQSLQQAAAAEAEKWKKGLLEWGIEPARLQALKAAAEFCIYTPGSDAGVPVSILASLKAPPLSWEGNREVLLEKISGTVMALLGLVGLENIDPVRSREHILLSNIFEQTWRQGRDLDLGELILQTQNPPFQKLGVFDVNTFYPEKERFELAMLLNNILAAPTFQSWISGVALDIPSILYTPAGKPRHSVFYLAHLNDAERMFFVTLLYSAVEAWMRTQPGTSSLKAILYFDEIFGYFPPVANPPSKPLLLRMMKQARAFGVGQVLVTQNPVDVDYKGLSNAGTWIVGKLQTDQDKQRLLDGLDSALSGGLDRGQYDKLISTLGKRVFLMHNVHAKGPQVFQSRWAMNYLAGPLTRAQIPALNRLAGAKAEFAAAPQAGQARPSTSESKTAPVAGLALTSNRPALPGGVQEYFYPNDRSLNQAAKAAGVSPAAGASAPDLVYQPVLAGQVNIRYLNRKYNLDYEQVKAVLVKTPDRRGMVRWDEFSSSPVDVRKLERQPESPAQFGSLSAPLDDPRTMADLEKDFLEWAFRNAEVKVKTNPALKLFAGPEVSSADFRTRCAEEARKGKEVEAKKLSQVYDKKLAALMSKLTNEQRELVRDQAELSQRQLEEGGNIAETLAGFVGITRKKSVGTAFTKHRMTSQAKADVEESQQVIADVQKQIAALEAEKNQELEAINQRWGELAGQVDEMDVVPLRKDLLVEFFGVVWLPHYQVKSAQGEQLIPAYSYGESHE